MNIRKTIIMATAFAAMLLTLGLLPAHAQEKSRYMGGEVTLKTAPNGAVVNADVLETDAKILYLEPTTEKVADGVWCIGGVLAQRFFMTLMGGIISVTFHPNGSHKLAGPAQPSTVLG